MEEPNVIKFLVEANNEKMILEFSNEVTMEELVNHFATVASFITFSLETIKEYLYPDEG